MGAIAQFLENYLSQPEKQKEDSTESRPYDPKISSSATYYLLSTLKLTCHTTHGQVSIEKLTREKAIRVIESIQNGESSVFARSHDAFGIPETFTLQVCAVHWEKYDERVRIRAVPDAASVRFFDIDSDQFDAYFHHDNLHIKRDDGVTPSLSQPYVGISACKKSLPSLEAFFEELAQNNKRSLKEFGQHHLLSPDHFAGIFSEHEANEIQPILNHLHSTADKTNKLD